MRVACAVLVVAEAEEIWISATLPVWQADVRSLRHAHVLRTQIQRAAESP